MFKQDNNFYRGANAIRNAIIFGFLIIMFMPGLFSWLGFFTSSYELYDYSDEYHYQQYDVEANVLEDNSVEITEQMSVYFSVASRGITRVIPLIQTVSFVDNTGKERSMNYKVDITDVLSLASTTKLYEVDNQDNYLYIKLGSKTEGEVYFQELENFSLSYKIELGDDRLLGMDQFYFNLIGQSFDTDINNSSITVNFFKSIPEDTDFYVYYGGYGSTDNVIVAPFNEQRTIYKYTHNQVLHYGEGLTARVLLPQGFFEVGRSYLYDILLLCALAAAILVSVLMFFKKTNKKVIVPVVNFEPPKNMKPTEVGYAIDNKVDNKDVAAMIVYWAEKGYLKIVEEEEDKLKTIYLEKVKDADEDMTVEEGAIFNGIFASSTKTDISTIGIKIYSRITDYKNKITRDNKSKYFNLGALSFRNTMAFLTAVLLAIVTYKIGSARVEPLALLFGLGISVVWYAIMYGLIYTHDYQYTYSQKSKKKTMFVFGVIAILTLIGYSFATYDYYSDPLMLTFVGAIFAALGGFLLFKINVRTDEGIDILGQLIGLRQFIELAEKDRLEMLVKEDPEAFYKILPYAYVLGVSDTWIEKFEDIVLEVPSWYETNSVGTNLLTTHIILSSLNSSFNSINKGISTLPAQSSSGGGFSGFGGGGGGFSGGGFGGGGGGRW